MSADNWTSCPACKSKDEDGLAALKKRLDEEYGKISRAEYKDLEAQVGTLTE